MKTALLVIDLQTGLFAEEPPPSEADAVIERINALAERARAQGDPVIFVQHEEPGTAWAFGAAGWDLDPRVKVCDSDLRLRKTTLDSFLDSPLQSMLAAHDVDRLTVCGYATEFCVDTTVRRAAALGYSVTLVSDGHTTQDKPYLSAALIRRHHNETLAEVTSFRGKISVAPAASLWK